MIVVYSISIPINQMFYKGKRLLIRRLLHTQPDINAAALRINSAHKQDLLGALFEIFLVDADRIDPQGRGKLNMAVVLQSREKVLRDFQISSTAVDILSEIRRTPDIGQSMIVLTSTDFGVVQAEDKRIVGFAGKDG